MEKDQLISVLSELLDESKHVNEGTGELKSSTNDFDKKLTEIKISTPETDLTPLKQELGEGIIQLKTVIEMQSKKIVR